MHIISIYKSVCPIFFFKSCCAQTLKVKTKKPFTLWNFDRSINITRKIIQVWILYFVQDLKRNLSFRFKLSSLVALSEHWFLLAIFFYFTQSLTCPHRQVVSNKIKQIGFAFSRKKDRAVHERRNYKQSNSLVFSAKIWKKYPTKSFSLLSTDTFNTKTYTCQ